MNLPYQHNPRAIKPHQCDCCNDTLMPGRNYYLLTFYTDSIEKVKLCYECFDIYEKWHKPNVHFYADVDDLIYAISDDYRATRAIDTAEARADDMNDERWLEKEADIT